MTVRDKWPNAQWVVCRPEDWSPEERAGRGELVKRVIIDGIRLSESGVLFEDVLEQRRMIRQYKRLFFSTLAIGLVAIVGLLMVLRVNSQLTESDHKLNEATQAMKKMQRELMQGREDMVNVASILERLMEGQKRLESKEVNVK